MEIRERVIERIMLKSEELKRWAMQFNKKRSMFEKAKRIGKEYYVGITGLRGIGKTVLLLQLANSFKDSVYFSADWKYLKPYEIYEIVEKLRVRGFKNIFIDEIHTKEEWSSDIKTIYDEHEVRVFFSGSSSINIKESSGDLSRRAILLNMKPASFREYLMIRKGIEIPIYSITEIIKKKKELSLKYGSMGEYLREYMRYGGVLYSGNGFYEALGRTIEKIVVKDLAALREIDIKYENEVYKFLYHVSNSNPYELSYSSLSQKLGVSKTFLIRMVSDLVKVGIIQLILPCKKRNIDVKKEPKIFLAIPFRSFYSEELNAGALREEFFVNHVDVDCYYKTKRGEKTSDFRVGDRILEIGGSSKKEEQKPDVIVNEGLRFDGKYVPLFLFGFLY